ncbi:uncharacterized protein LOC131165390 [Malania oleifera]|uniref:uncharacterized protein LOC131165390 n=1 Tax=Malania oleifera TaxID=397392 RepID=UPI0025AE8B3C|nr:uncharacterized protein LOC131165390 [Malania oleifera]
MGMVVLKKSIAAVMILAVVMAASAEVGEALSQCGKDCMPVCLRVEGATIPACQVSCEDFCNHGGNKGGGGQIDFSKFKFSHG